MADVIIILVLLGAAVLAIRSCLRKSKDGGCSGCGGNCGCRRKDKE